MNALDESYRIYTRLHRSELQIFEIFDSSCRFSVTILDLFFQNSQKHHSDRIFFAKNFISFLPKLWGISGKKEGNLKKESQKNKLEIDTNKIEELIKKRNLAKANKDFLLADKIRADLRNIGIELIDKPQGLTEWKQLLD